MNIQNFIFLLIFSAFTCIGQEPCKDSIICFVSKEFPEFEFEIQKRFESSSNTAVYQTPLLADVDNDCIPDIVMSDVVDMVITPRLTSGIVVISSLDGSVKFKISTPFYSWSCPSSYVVGDVDNDGVPEIIIVSADHSFNPPNLRGKLVCYNFDGSIKWISDQQFGVNVPFGFGGSVGLADFNQDGVPEVYIYNEIFNAATGIKLAEGGLNGVGYGIPINQNIGSSAISIAGQLDEDEGDLELAAGFTVYKVQINNTSGMTGNQMIPMNIEVDGQFRDGFTSLGDINGDGKLDIVVGSIGGSNIARLYVYDIQNNQTNLIAKVSPITGGGPFDFYIGPPFIGDITGDGKPSIGITRPFRLITYDYDGTELLKTKWVLNTSDQSGQTGMTMFDFNQDGRQEIVYRDELTLRVIDGRTNPEILVSYSCRSETGVEYAIVGDIDNTGESKICTTCADSGNNFLGTVHVLSAPIGKQPWAASRGVWNQYAYHVFNINDDLTVPHIQLNNATFADGTFNNFYVQASNVDEKGNFIQPAADLSGEISCLKFNESTGNVEISFTIFNNSTASLKAPPGIIVSFYHGNPATIGTLIGTFTTNSPIDPGNSLDDLLFSFGISNIYYPNGIYMLINSTGFINDDFTDSANFNLIECDFENNVVPYPDVTNITALDVTICEGETYDYFGISLSEEGEYFQREVNQNDCDSILNILQLHISNISNQDLFVNACESYSFNNEIITQSGVYLLETTNIYGCDSIVTLTLEIEEPITYFFDELSCSDFYWELADWTISESGTYNHILVNENGCDTLLFLDLTVRTPELVELVQNICEGEAYNFDGSTLTTSGLYSSQIADIHGCDSIMTNLNLIVHEPTFEEFSIGGCESVDLNGTIIEESGEYLFEYSSIIGCDSTVLINIEISHPSLNIEEVVACGEFYWPANELTYSESGSYEHFAMDRFGCDSITSIHLVINDIYETSEIIETDKDYFWRVNNTLISQSGEYSEYFSSRFDCDSIHHLIISIRKFRSIWVPNVFSPNFDGLNDEVFVHASDGVDEIIKFSIYNRWGALVFEENNFPPNHPAYGWDGIFNGQQVNQGVFVYVVQWIGNSGTIEQLSGDITVLKY